MKGPIDWYWSVQMDITIRRRGMKMKIACVGVFPLAVFVLGSFIGTTGILMFW